MVRVFGVKLSFRQNKSGSRDNNNTATRRRLVESARDPQSLRERHPLYEYAIKEYAQTVRAGSSNDDGKDRHHNQQHSQAITQQQQQQQQLYPQQQQPYQQQQPFAITPPGSISSRRQQHPYDTPTPRSFVSSPHPPPSPPPLPPPPLPPGLTAEEHPSQQKLSPQAHTPHHPYFHHTSSTTSSSTVYLANQSSVRAEPALSRDYQSHISDIINGAPGSGDKSNLKLPRVDSTISTSIFSYYEKTPFEEGMVSGILYEESYGDAYTGAPMRYVYPAGYQAMRPRSGPWRLSILICLLFTWLSIFVVGHCSDQVVEAELYYHSIDDDSLLINIRWCGSRPLYLMWVASMLITGLSAAYCGVIGYIKCRDFAVANGRSQPFWNAQDHASDYYYYSNMTTTTTEEEEEDGGGTTPGAARSRRGKKFSYVAPPESATATNSLVLPPSRNRNASIYQADGEPQFWGSHIYRPTQAAVAVTSR